MEQETLLAGVSLLRSASYGGQGENSGESIREEERRKKEEGRRKKKEERRKKKEYRSLKSEV